MTEAIVAEIGERLEGYGGRLRWVHIRDSRMVAGSAGFPDFIIAGPGGILFRECKPHPGAHLKPHQTSWRWMLVAAGADYAVWTPDQLADGTVGRELEAIL